MVEVAGSVVEAWWNGWWKQRRIRRWKLVVVGGRLVEWVGGSSHVAYAVTMRERWRDCGPSVTTRILLRVNNRRIASSNNLLLRLTALASCSLANCAGA